MVILSVDDGKAGQLNQQATPHRPAGSPSMQMPIRHRAARLVADIQQALHVAVCQKSSKISTRSPEFRNFLARVMSYRGHR